MKYINDIYEINTISRPLHPGGHLPPRWQCPHFIHSLPIIFFIYGQEPPLYNQNLPDLWLLISWSCLLIDIGNCRLLFITIDNSQRPSTNRIDECFDLFCVVLFGTLLRASSIQQTHVLERRENALGMSHPIWGPLIHIFVDEKKNWEG